MKALKRLLVPVSLAVLILIPFWDLLRLPGDQVIAGRDIDWMFLQWWGFGLESVRQGELPLWNPYLYSGVPFLANPQPALFYPPVWLLGILPAARVVGLLIVLHLWIGGLGMYGWLRSENADRYGAFFGAILFAFSGYFSVRVFAGHLGVVMTLAWLPAVLWAYNAALKRASYAASILAGAVVGLAFLAGHTASFLYVGLALAAYVLFKAWGSWRLKNDARASLLPLTQGAVMVVFGLGLAAVQLLPTLEFVGLSTRQTGNYAFAADHSWPPGYLVTLFVPNFFGEPGRVGYWGDGVYEELILYAGVLPLVLLLVLGWRRITRDRLVAFLVLFAGSGLLLALGQFGILHRVAFNFLPVFGNTRAPARAGFLFTFAIAALGGLLLTWMIREPEEARSDLRGTATGPFVWLVIAVTSLVVLASFLIFALERESNAQAGRLWHTANNTALFLFFFALSVGLLAAFAAGRLSARQFAVLAVGVVLLDLWGFARAIIHPAPVQESAYWRAVSEITAGGEGRVLPWGLSIFEHNKGLAFDLNSVFAYDPLELERYHRLTTSVPDPQARAYDLLHTRYLVTSSEMEPAEGAEGLTLVDQRDGVWVYERSTALPQAWTVHRAEVMDEGDLLNRINDPAFDPLDVGLVEEHMPCELSPPGASGEARVVSRTANRLEVAVNGQEPGILILSEVFFPGWAATLDGQQVDIFAVDYVLRGICVPPGQHQVVFSFLPMSLRIGTGVTLFTLLSMAGASLFVWRARSS